MAATERKVQGETVADGVLRFGNGAVNWYLVRDGDRFAAFDAGFPADWRHLVRALEGLGRSVSDVSDVVLTHGHLDHVGFAERAHREAGATVRLHTADVRIARSPVPIAKSERSPALYLWRPPTVALFTLATLARGPFGQRVSAPRTLAPGETLADVPGHPEVVFTPGHTDGHCALHLPDRGVLFTGDALVTRDPYTGRTGPRLVARAATADVRRNLASLDAIAATGAQTLLPGHGEPWTGGAQAAADAARAAGSA
jgi:glyoxylase-like metal-dependent hydrolase (beta-lactamase superfamily II)